MATFYDLERLDDQYREFMVYLEKKWQYVKEGGNTAEMIQFLDDGEEFDKTFPLMEVIRKGRFLFKEFE